MAAVACLCLVIVGGLSIENNLHHKSEDPLSGKFVGNVIEIIDSNQCLVEVTAGDHNLLEGSNAYIQYERIVRNSEIYNETLIKGDILVVVYDSIQFEEDNGKNIITVDCIEILDEIESTE
mgnify:FL=1